MQIKLNEMQKELLQLARKKGFLRLEDFFIYATASTRRCNLQRFVTAGILKETAIVGKFDYNGN